MLIRRGKEAEGRADAVVKTKTVFMFLSLSWKGTVDEALKQIDEKRISVTLSNRRA